MRLYKSAYIQFFTIIFVYKYSLHSKRVNTSIYCHTFNIVFQKRSQQKRTTFVASTHFNKLEILNILLNNEYSSQKIKSSPLKIEFYRGNASLTVVCTVVNLLLKQGTVARLVNCEVGKNHVRKIWRDSKQYESITKSLSQFSTDAMDEKSKLET